MSTTTAPIDTPALTRKGKHRTGAGARFNADAIGIYRAVNVGVLLSALAAVLISWNGLAYVGQWVLLPPFMTWLVPVMIDVPIVVFTLATLARRSRGESTFFLALAAYVLTATSAGANFLHVAAERPLNTIEGAVGASIAALAPMLVLLTTEALGTLITKPPSENSPRAKAKRQADELKTQKADIAKLKKELKAANERADKAEAQIPKEPREVIIPAEKVAEIGRAALAQMNAARQTNPTPANRTAVQVPARSVVDELQQEVAASVPPPPSDQAWWQKNAAATS
ncbi:DUF2637 domain-containing protein [Microbacterium sp. LMI12-1-1.1]|uniref:DUF2637 domain-containing protein n=1 Tax=Microbacterium sp. LMI12-1-1.1 TaxID=3135225 RepID=UPI0034388425